MRALSTGLQWAIRITGVAQIALGLAFWTGNLLTMIPLHMLTGLVFVALLEVQAVLAAFRGVSWRLVGFTIVWGLVVPVLGMTQFQILPGAFHWVVQVAHLVVGVVAIGLAERVSRGAGARLADRSAALAAQ